jgi:F-type H+-transporting ATPase subunit b
MIRLRSARTTWLALGLCAFLFVGAAGVRANSQAAGHGATEATPQRSSQTPAGDHQPAEGEHEGGGAVQQIARLVNFAILAGTLVYFLRSPLVTYLRNRKAQVQSDLVKAGETRAAAAARLAEIDQKIQALPGELDALRRRGTEEARAEETRLRDAATAERARLLDHARREIEGRLKLAERELIRHAAALAVAVATERVKRTMTEADQLRLADRYLAQVGSPPRQQA